MQLLTFAVFFIGSTLLFGNQDPGHEVDQLNLINQWEHVGFIYRGERIPKLNPDLMIHYRFTGKWLENSENSSEDNFVGESELFYFRTNEQGSCRRRAIARFSKTTMLLYQKVIWTDPNNRFDCARDPDMVINQESWTPIKLTDLEFQLFGELGEEQLVFVFTPLVDKTERDASAHP